MSHLSFIFLLVILPVHDILISNIHIFSAHALLSGLERDVKYPLPIVDVKMEAHAFLQLAALFIVTAHLSLQVILSDVCPNVCLRITDMKFGGLWVACRGI